MTKADRWTHNIGMFVVEKVARGHRYLYLVESIREPGGRVRQRILQPLGRKDILVASGALERLLQSIGRHCERSLIFSEIAAGTIACRRIGAPLLFGRLWERLGIAEVLRHHLAGRCFGFDVERAVYVTTLHRLTQLGQRLRK